ncbi:MAG: DUF5107 domain-containing protein [Bacillota bacterium]|nr:DUF5107 domain-containing protein [Bacillota bacterium]
MADLGRENPLPDMRPVLDPHARVQLDDSIPERQRPYFHYGKVHTILPYRLQDGYSRRRCEAEMPVVVLENRYLTATFTPQYGGKLWNLHDRTTGRDLLHANPVFQPANLALRNAWTSGGVEWNIGMTGHTPFTLSPLHVAVLELPDGTPVLRMYEWERVREVSYQIDAWLPAESKFLMVRVRLVNTRETVTPIYWWSNMAVELQDGTRVLAPANRAYAYGYGRGVTLTEVPLEDGVDLSYPVRAKHSGDWFFDIDDGMRKWEAAVDSDGYGLIQTSTDRLIGRKLFRWGTGPGGLRWQDFLAEPGRAYLETQAGLAKTQMQHLPLPGGAVWDWLEAYGAVKLDPALAHGEWEAAWRAADRQLETDLPRAELDRIFAESRDLLAAEGRELEAWPARGSGWAALELARRAAGGEAARCFASEAAAFGPETLGAEQAPWLTLLRTGVLPEGSPAEEPHAYLTQSDWRDMLERSVARGDSAHWQGWLQLGVMRYAASDVDGAMEAFRKSEEAWPNAWARRNLAVLLLQRGEAVEATELLYRAYQERPILPLAIEAGRALIRNGRQADYVRLYDAMPARLQAADRPRILLAEALVETGELERAEAILSDPELEIADVREGEVLLSDIWVALQKKKHAEELAGLDEDQARRTAICRWPIPAHLDFRMRT